MSSHTLRGSPTDCDDVGQDKMIASSNTIRVGAKFENPEAAMSQPKSSHRETHQSRPLEPSNMVALPSFRRYSQSTSSLGHHRIRYDRDEDVGSFSGRNQGPRQLRDMSFLNRRKGDLVVAKETYSGDNEVGDDAEMDDIGMDSNENGFFVDKAEMPRELSSRSMSLAPSRRAHRRDFTIPGAANRLPSRASGFPIQSAGVNKAPTPVPTASISNASLLKRGLIRGGDATMIKRATGPNDPENVQIINMVENEQMKWSEIAEILNNQRIAVGAKPSFTPNAVHNRYNRNAPLHFKAEGKEFVPINKRRGGDNGSRKWTAEGDELLVRTAQQVDAKKWQEVADIFNAHGEYEITAEEAAKRMEIL